MDFDTFYLETARYTHAVVRRAAGGDPGLAEDAVQEAYVVMLRTWVTRQAQSIKSNQRYVVGIAMNKLNDEYRNRHRVSELREWDLPAVADTDDERATLATVRAWLQAQPAQRRIVGVMYLLEDYTYDEIASTLGVQVSTVRTHWSRGCQTM